MSTMRAIDIKNGTGPPSSLFINRKIPKPKPKAGEALVKIHAFGLNRMDLMQRVGNYNVPPQAGPILGVEFSGVVEEIGGPPLVDDDGNVKEEDFKPGDEVFGLAYGGAYAEYIASSMQMLMRKPKELSFEQCAGIPETWLTATQSLYLVGCFNPHKDQAVLFHAGASAVSIALIQLARLASKDVKIFVTAGSEEKIKLCESLGATQGFNYHSEDWVTGIKDETRGRGVDVIVDFIGRSYAQGNLEVVAMDERMVQLASMSGGKLPEGVDIGLLEKKRVRWEGSRLRSRELGYQRRLRDLFMQVTGGDSNKGGELLKGFKDEKLRVVIEKVFNWRDITEAHELMEANKSKGKIICVVD